MKIKLITPVKDGLVNVIIETPANSRHKYDFDTELELFGLNKTLPLGMSFPYDFGFIPNTKGPDGDPLDVLVLMDEPGYPGCLVQCRMLGILEAEQTERNGSKMRNDRLLAVAESSIIYASYASAADLNKRMTGQIERFFINYNEMADKKFTPLQWADTERAMANISKHSV